MAAVGGTRRPASRRASACVVIIKKVRIVQSLTLGSGIGLKHSRLSPVSCWLSVGVKEGGRVLNLLVLDVYASIPVGCDLLKTSRILKFEGEKFSKVKHR